MTRMLHWTVVTAAAVALFGCTDATSPLTGLAAVQLPDLGSMHVGDVRVMTFAEAQQGLTIPASLSSAVYAIVAANVAGDTGSVSHYTITGNRQSVTASSVPMSQQSSPAVSFLRPSYSRISGNGTPGAQFERQLRSYEQSRLRLPVRHTVTSPLLRADRVPAGTVPSVGEQFQFNVPGNSANLCTQYNTTTATIEAVSTHAIIAVDNRSLNSGFTAATYDSIATEFDTYIYPTEVAYYGSPTDIDNNGHIFILYTPDVNVLTPAGTATTQGVIGGFTFAGDFFPPIDTASGGCPESNDGEIFYLLAPDPTGQYGNVFTTADVRMETRSTIAHEFQHAINSGNRVVKGAYAFESAWLDEALSSLAEDNVGRAELGYGDLETLSLSTFRSMDATMFNTFFAANFGRTQIYVTQPDTVGALVTDAREEQDLAAFGAGWAFLRYVVDWYSNDNPEALTRSLVAGPDTGTLNVVKHAGVPLDTLLAHWLVTLYTDGQGISGLPAQYNYRTYNLRDIVSALCPTISCTGPRYLPVTSIGSGTTSTPITIPSSSADYFVTDETTGGARTIMFTNPDGTAATDKNGRVYVVRVQ